MKTPSLTRYAWLSIAAALFTILLKTAAYLLTGPVGLLSDALESVVNLIGATMVLAMLIIAATPPDDEHSYGHSKAEYFSSGVEGALIVIAAISIAVVAGKRLMNPQPIEQVGWGLTISLIASARHIMHSILYGCDFFLTLDLKIKKNYENRFHLIQKFIGENKYKLKIMTPVSLLQKLKNK